MIKDLVSIVIPTYNDEPYLRKALDDMVNQTYRPIEIIVVDDGSTDNTWKILKEYSKKYDFVKCYQKNNGGTGSALNEGFRYVSGEYGTWVSSDDEKAPHMIERLVNFLKKNRSVELVFSAFESRFVNCIWRTVIPDDTSVKGYKIINPGNAHDGKPSGKEFIVDEWVDVNALQCHSGVNHMFTMDLKRRCGDYLTIPGEDYYMTVKMALNSRVGYIDEILGTHNAPPDGLSMVNRACVVEANVLTHKMIKEEYIPWKLNRIPKIANFYWGCSKMSYLRYLTLLSFKTMNPDWSVRLFVPEDISDITWKDDIHKCDVVDYKEHKCWFEEIKKLPIKITRLRFKNKSVMSEAHKSDFLRWFILKDTGGLWADMDILFVKPMSGLYYNTQVNSQIDTVLHIDANEHGNTIGFYLGKAGGNPYFNLIFREAEKRIEQKDLDFYQSIGANLVNEMFTSKIVVQQKMFPEHKFFNMSKEVVYKYDFRNLKKIYDENNFKEFLESDATLGIHWYGGHPKSQIYNNMLHDFEDVGRCNNTLCEAIKYVTAKAIERGFVK